MLGVRTTPALLAAAGLLVLSACSGGSDEGTEAEASATPTASESASDSAGPSPSESASDQEQLAPDPPKAPKARDTPASREDFARFVMDSWSYALSTNKAAAVTSLSPRGKPCVGCKDLTQELAQRKKEGWFVDFPGVAVDSIKVTPLSSAPGVWAATAKVDIPASRSYFDDGTYRNDNDAHKNTDFVITMRLVGPKYVLLSYHVG